MMAINWNGFKRKLNKLMEDTAIMVLNHDDLYISTKIKGKWYLVLEEAFAFTSYLDILYFVSIE